MLLVGLALTALGLPASAQQTLFTSQTPVVTGQNDGVTYELGMKFQSSVAGQITAIRYWKDAQESGVHVGNIWSSTGTLLASTTFANETASGWQQQALSTPLSINGNTTYTVSVNINAFYVATVGPTCYPCAGSSLGLYFPITNGALTSIADDNNGVFVSPGGFPTETFKFSNYFRDVVFTPGVPNPPQPAGCFEKLVSVDGGNTFAAFTSLSNPAVALPGLPVEFKLVVTNCGNVPVTPGTTDDCVNADPKAVPFACAPTVNGGLGAPGLIIYEPPTPAPTSSPLAPGESVTYSKTQLPNLLVTTTEIANLCQTALQLTGQSVVRNDAQFDGSDANGNPVSYEADAYVQCSGTQITASCVVINAVQGTPITPVTLTASGGAGGPYTFTATGLPNGLTISSGGTISGTPTVSGTFNYTVTITDSAGNKGTVNCSVTVFPPITASCVVINAVQGTPITPVTLTASGGAGGPYTFTATGLPNGLTISSGGTISGTPTVSGTFNYSVTITDSAGNKGTVNCSVMVQPQTGSACKIGPSSMEGALTNILPGDWISGGYDFTIPGSHPQITVTVTNPTVTLPVFCPQGGGSGGNIVINLPSATYLDPANNSNWIPTGDQNSVLSWEGSVQAPNLCGGKPMANQSGAIYNATTNTEGGANFRFKYRDPNAKGKGNVNCADPNWVPISQRNDAATCGASWSQTVTCQ